MTSKSHNEVHSIELSSADDLLAFLESSGKDRFDWFRGHSDKTYPLWPQLLRPGQLRREDALLGTFVQRAGALPGAPGLDDYTAWVSIAQHHGLPTRALDWSESFLVALYFAVIGSSDDSRTLNTDGAVWVLNPVRLNQVHCSEANGVCRESDLGLMNAHYKAIFGRSLGAGFKTWDVTAYRAQYRNPRMVAQKAAFTWHLETTPLELHPEASTYLRRVVVPGAAKAKLLKHITALGVSESTLFPDFEGIAKELRRRIPRLSLYRRR